MLTWRGHVHIHPLVAWEITFERLKENSASPVFVFFHTADLQFVGTDINKINTGLLCLAFENMDIRVPAPMPRAPWAEGSLPEPPPFPPPPRVTVPIEQIEELFRLGDVAVKLGEPSYTGKRVLIVSSEIMMNASSVFHHMLTGTTNPDISLVGVPVRFDLPYDNPDALDMILRIMHCREVKDFAMLKIDTIYDISRVADQYAMRDVITPWIGRWIELNENIPRADMKTWTKLWYLSLSVRHLNRMETLSAEYIWKQKRVSSREEYHALASFTPRPLLEALSDKLSELNMEFIAAIQEELDEKSDVIHRHEKPWCEECSGHSAYNSIYCNHCHRALVPNAVSDTCDHASRQKLIGQLVIHFCLTDGNAVFTPLIRMSLEEITESVEALVKGVSNTWDEAATFDCPIIHALDSIQAKLTELKEDAIIKKDELARLLQL